MERVLGNVGSVVAAQRGLLTVDRWLVSALLLAAVLPDKQIAAVLPKQKGLGRRAHGDISICCQTRR